MFPICLNNPVELERKIAQTISRLGPEVVRTRYNSGEDWAGDPAIYFRIVLADETTRDGSFSRVARRIRQAITNELRPQEDWNLLPYCSFRSVADEAVDPDPLWS